MEEEKMEKEERRGRYRGKRKKNIPNINPPRVQKLNTTPFKSTQHFSKGLIELNSFFCIIDDFTPFPICLIEFLE